jgi:hypothetical protein
MGRSAIAKFLWVIAVSICVGCASATTRAPEPATVDPDWPIVEGLPREAASIGRIFIPLAKEFGPFAFSYAAPASGGSAYLFEYNLVDEKIGEWSRIIPLIIMPVGVTWEESEAILPNYAVAFHQNKPSVHAAGRFEGDHGGVYFIHYTIGGGPLQEEGLAMMWAPYPGAIANFQMMNRGKRYTSEEIDHFKNVASGISRSVPR